MDSNAHTTPHGDKRTRDTDCEVGVTGTGKRTRSLKSAIHLLAQPKSTYIECPFDPRVTLYVMLPANMPADMVTAKATLVDAETREPVPETAAKVRGSRLLGGREVTVLEKDVEDDGVQAFEVEFYFLVVNTVGHFRLRFDVEYYNKLDPCQYYGSRISDPFEVKAFMYKH